MWTTSMSRLVSAPLKTRGTPRPQVGVRQHVRPVRHNKPFVSRRSAAHTAVRAAAGVPRIIALLYSHILPQAEVFADGVEICLS